MLESATYAALATPAIARALVKPPKIHERFYGR